MSGSCLNQGSDDLNSSGGVYTEGGHPQLVVACLMFCLGRQELPSRYQIRTASTLTPPERLALPFRARCSPPTTGDCITMRFAAVRESVLGARRAKAALSSGCSPTRQSLQQEAIGAVMEVTK